VGLTQRVTDRVREDFPTPPDQEDIRTALSWYGEESSGQEQEQERVQIAILDLAKGSTDQVLGYVLAAKEDYRDVLYWAYYYPKERSTT